MSYNIRCDTLMTFPGEDDYWPARRIILRELLSTSNVDILGVQELMSHQIEDITESLGDKFHWIGKPRDTSTVSESCAIFYNTELFELIAEDTFWLSETPNVVGSITWNNECPRIVTWGIFKIRENGKLFIVANTHLDHISAESRIKSAMMMVEIFKNNQRVIIMGDFNLNAGCEHYGYFIDSGFKDTQKSDTMCYGTWGGYKPPVVDGERIDWILCSEDVTVINSEVDTFNIEGKYASDHLPVRARLEI